MSASAGTGSMPVKASGPASPGFGAAAAGSGHITGSAAAAASAPPPASTARRDSCRPAISAKVGSVEGFGSGRAHWLSHFRWQVTALRLPWVSPSMGRFVKGSPQVGVAVGLRAAARTAPGGWSNASGDFQAANDTDPAIGQRVDELWVSRVRACAGRRRRSAGLGVACADMCGETAALGGSGCRVCGHVRGDGGARRSGCRVCGHVRGDGGARRVWAMVSVD